MASCEDTLPRHATGLLREKIKFGNVDDFESSYTM
jgi:hypothetical protein